MEDAGRQKDDVDRGKSGMGQAGGDVLVVELPDVEDVGEGEVDGETDDEQHGCYPLEEPRPHPPSVRGDRLGSQLVTPLPVMMKVKATQAKTAKQMTTTAIAAQNIALWRLTPTPKSMRMIRTPFSA